MTSSSPLPHAITDPSLAHRAHCFDAFRKTQNESNDAVTKCNMLHFWCDMSPFCEPDHVHKIIYTLLREVETAVPNECFNG